MIIRTNKISGSFVIIHKGYIQNPNLSAKAKGIMTYLLSLPDDWQIHINELVKHFKDGRSSIASGLKELEQEGYLTKNQKRDEKGKFIGYEYILNEAPQSRKPVSGKSVYGKSVYGKSQPTNNNNTNNNLTNNNIINKRILKNSPVDENLKKETKDNFSLRSQSETFTLENNGAIGQNGNNENTETEKQGLPEKDIQEELLSDNVQGGTKSQNKGVIPDKQKIKELTEKIVKIFTKIYKDKTELKFPSSEYGKLKRLIQKKFLPVMLEFAKQEGWSDDDLLYRVKVIILYSVLQGNMKVEYILGMPAEIFGEIRLLQENHDHYRYKFFKRAIEEINTNKYEGGLK